MMQLKEREEGNIKGGGVVNIGQLHPNDIIQRVEGEQHYRGRGRGGAMRDYCMQRMSTQRDGGGQT